jgi:hypothetical protein
VDVVVVSVFVVLVDGVVVVLVVVIVVTVVDVVVEVVTVLVDDVVVKHVPSSSIWYVKYGETSNVVAALLYILHAPEIGSNVKSLQLSLWKAASQLSKHATIPFGSIVVPIN